MLKIGIIGGRSVVAGELLRILSSHKKVEITYVESSSKPGLSINEEHTFLQGKLSLCFSSLNMEIIERNCDLLFVSRPHMQSANLIKDLPKNTKIIDMGADFRLKNPKLYPQWYKVTHPCPELINRFTYGLCEINRKAISKSSYIANPGCYPTSVILACYPIGILKEWDFSGMIVDSYSGVSGAGKAPSSKNHFLNVHENIIPYKAGIHPHTAEMEQMLEKAEQKVNILFFPHVMPIERGIVSTIFIPLPKKIPKHKEIVELYKNFYKNDYFIRISENEENYPKVKDVNHTNFCNIGFRIDERTNYLVITSVIDNTMKGAAGQGVQNMNIMEGFPENEGFITL